MSVFPTQRSNGPPPEVLAAVFPLAPSRRTAALLQIQALPTAVAVDDYDAENHRELSFKRDDVIHIMFWSPNTRCVGAGRRRPLGLTAHQLVEGLVQLASGLLPARRLLLRSRCCGCCCRGRRH